MKKSQGIQSVEIDDPKTNRSIDINRQILIGIDWYQSIDDQSITTWKSFIDWHRTSKQTPHTLLVRSSATFRKPWGWNWYWNNSDASFSHCTCTWIIHLPVIAFPCHNVYARCPGRGFTEYKVHCQKLSSLPFWSERQSNLVPRVSHLTAPYRGW